jgi:PAS domain S-box-containing protein
MRILIAEDSVVALTLLKAALGRWGYDVVSVTNGTDALAMLQCADAPGLAILDVDMPGLDGIEVCRRLKQAHLPIPTYLILLTANANKAAIVDGLQAGADDYVTKPFDPGELQARVQVGARMAELQTSVAQHIRELQETSVRIDSQRQRLDSIIMTVPGLVWETCGEPNSATQQIDFVSDYVETLLGYTVAEWLATPNFWLTIVHADDKERAGREAAAGFASTGNTTLQFRWIAKDGRTVWVESNFIAIKDDNGKPIGLRGVTTDINERKLADAEREQLSARIESQRQRLESIVMTVPGVVWEAWRDPNPAKQRIDFVSDYVETMLGYGVKEWLATPNFWFSIVHPEDQAQARMAAANFATIGKRPTQFRWIAKDGRIVWVETNFIAITNEEGVIICLRGVTTDINERKHAEDALRESEERYRDAVENARDIIYTHDLQGNYTSANKASEEITGYTRAESLQMNLADTVAPEYQERARQMLAGRHADDQDAVYDLEIIAKDGHRVAVEVSTRLVFQGDTPIGVQGIARDVTERRRAEAMEIRRAAQLALRSDINTALAEGHSPLQQILGRCAEAMVQHCDAAFARIWTLNTDGEILDLQASAGIYTHLDGGHAHIPVGAFKIGYIAEVRQPHTTNEVRTDPRISDQEWAAREGMVSFAGYPLIVDDRLIGVMALFARQPLAVDTLDALASIAAFIAQGIDRKRAQEELQESAERYRLLFDHNPQPGWVYDLETLSISSVNEAATRHYGYTREEFLGMTIEDIGPQGDVGRMGDKAAEVGSESKEAGIRKHRKKDGSLIDVEIASHEFLFGGRRAELVLANDITERKMLEVQLRHGQKLESIGQLAAGISHEINTPTQYVSDNTRFLRDAFQDLLQVHEKYGQLAEACRQGAETAELLVAVETAARAADVEFLTLEIPKAIEQSLEGTQRISKIVQSMKDFAHPGTAVKQACDLNKAIDSTITVACSEWKYVAEMVTDFDQTLPLVPCLQGEFNQVVLNLIINASHAIGDVIGDGSAGKGRITISTRHAGPWAEIRIGDTGTGIPEMNRARIFDPFFTTKQVGKGTGQGLSISHNVVVEKHGGTITLETAEGVGTTFIIRLPLQESARPSS